MGIWDRIKGAITGGRPSKQGGTITDRAVLTARMITMKLVLQDPVRYFGQSDVTASAVDPGYVGPLGPIDYPGILVDVGGSEMVLNAEMIARNVWPNLTPEAVGLHLERQMQAYRLGQEERIDFAEVQFRLLPRISWQAQDYLDVRVPWGELTLLVAIDNETSFQYVMSSHLSEWGRTAEEVAAVATENLRRQLSGVRAAQIPPERMGGLNCWTVSLDSNLEAVSVLIDEVVESVPIGREDMYVVIPSRDLVFIFEKPADPALRVRLAEVALVQYLSAAYQVSPYVYVWEDGHLVRPAAEEILGQAIPADLFLADGQVPIVATNPETGKEIAIPYPSRGLRSAH